MRNFCRNDEVFYALIMHNLIYPHEFKFSDVKKSTAEWTSLEWKGTYWFEWEKCKSLLYLHKKIFPKYQTSFDSTHKLSTPLKSSCLCVISCSVTVVSIVEKVQLTIIICIIIHPHNIKLHLIQPPHFQPHQNYNVF